jgi:hypothetical protein
MGMTAEDAALVWFCWSADQDRRHAAGDVVIHLQAIAVGKAGITACGIPAGGYWHYNVEPGEVAEIVTCRRCRAVVRRALGEGRVG